MGGKRGILVVSTPTRIATFNNLAKAVEYCNKYDIPLKEVTGTGGLIAAMKIYARYGTDYYKRIGRKGGQNTTSRPFATNRELASRAGKVGGKISKRGAAKKH